MLKNCVRLIGIVCISIFLFAGCDIAGLIDSLNQGSLGLSFEFDGEWELPNSTASNYNDLSLTTAGDSVFGTMTTFADVGGETHKFDGNIDGTIGEGHMSAVAEGRTQVISSTGQTSYINDVRWELELDMSDDGEELDGTIATVKMAGMEISNPYRIGITYRRK